MLSNIPVLSVGTLCSYLLNGLNLPSPIVSLLPISLLPSETLDAVCVGVAIFQLRQIEQRWGSSRTLVFLLCCSVSNMVLHMVLLSFVFPSSYREMLKCYKWVATVAAVLFAAAQRRNAQGRCVWKPSALRWEILVGCLFKPLLLPDLRGRGDPPLMMKMVVLVPLVVGGFLLAALASVPQTARTANSLQRYLYGVLAGKIQPIMARLLAANFAVALFGHSSAMRQSVLRKTDEEEEADALREIDRMERRPKSGEVANTYPAQLATIQALQLPRCSDEDILIALKISSGDIDQAVNILLSDK